MQLPLGLANTLSIIGIDNEDESLRVLEVVAPQWTDLVLTSDVPNREANVFVFYSLDVEAYCWNGCEDFAELKFVENCGFTSRI